MIDNTKTRTLTHVGAEPTKSVNYHLDNEGLIHVSKILRDMYSRPILAIVREYLANAVDAHVLAGVPLNKIKVLLPNIVNPMLEIQDSGPGLAQSTAETLLFGIGASGKEKRESNSFIGGFGVGCMSAFSVTDQFFYTSYHGGRQFTWRCYLNEHDEGCADLVTDMELTGDDVDRTGITIQIPLPDSQFSACRQAYIEAAWAIPDGPTVIRGKPEIDNLIQYQMPSYTWETAHSILDTPEYWRHKFLLNDKEVEWVWIPEKVGYNLLLGLLGSSGARVFVFLGHQLYPVTTHNLDKVLQTTGSPAWDFINNLCSIGGYWVFRGPIGLLPLAPTRETLKYSVMCQKLILGMLAAIPAAWTAQAKELILSFQSKIKSLRDVSTMLDCPYMEKVAKIADIVQRKCTDVAGTSFAKLALWKIGQLQCRVGFEATSINGTRTLKSTWSLPRFDGDVSPPPHFHTINVKKTRRSGATKVIVPEHHILDVTDTDLLVILRDPPDGTPLSVGYEKSLQYLLGDSVPEMLEGLGLPGGEDPCASIKELLDNSSVYYGNGVECVSVLTLYGMTEAEVRAQYPWMEGAYFLDYATLCARYKEEQDKRRAEARARRGPAPAKVPGAAPVVRRRLAIGKYHMAHKFKATETPIDVNKLEAASTRVYVDARIYRTYFPDATTGLSTIPIQDTHVQPAAFPQIAELLGEPTAYGLLEYHSSDPGHPDRFGIWTPYQVWVQQRLEIKLKEWDVSRRQMVHCATDLCDKAVLKMPDAAEGYRAGITDLPIMTDDLSSPLGIRQMELWYNWLRKRTTSTWGTELLQRWGREYGWDRPGGWHMWRALQAMKTLWPQAFVLAMPEATAWYGRVPRTRAAYVHAQGYRRRNREHQLTELNTMCHNAFGELRLLPGNLSWPMATEVEWQCWCRKSWVVFEGAWTNKKCPDLPAHITV